MQKPRGRLGIVGPFEVLILPSHGALAPNPLDRSAQGRRREVVCPHTLTREGTYPGRSTQSSGGGPLETGSAESYELDAGRTTGEVTHGIPLVFDSLAPSWGRSSRSLWSYQVLLGAENNHTYPDVGVSRLAPHPMSRSFSKWDI